MNNPHVTLKQLRVFLAVADTGSTTAAAATVALSQSATSAALLELETLLGLKLFDRTGKRLVLNADGRALAPQAQAVLEGTSGIERWAAEGPEQVGRLLIGASTTIGNYLLPDLLADFESSLPPAARANWGTRVLIANTATVVEQVRDFRLDVGLIEGPCHAPELTVLPWLRDELVIAASRRDPLLRRAGAAAVSVAELRNADWLLREPGSGTREAVEQALLPHLHHLRARLEFGSSEAIKRAVARGLGLTCLSRFALRDLLESGEIVELRTSLPRLLRPLSLIHHGQKGLSRGVRRLLEQLQAGTSPSTPSTPHRPARPAMAAGRLTKPKGRR